MENLEKNALHFFVLLHIDETFSVFIDFYNKNMIKSMLNYNIIKGNKLQWIN